LLVGDGTGRPVGIKANLVVGMINPAIADFANDPRFKTWSMQIAHNHRPRGSRRRFLYFPQMPKTSSGTYASSSNHNGGTKFHRSESNEF